MSDTYAVPTRSSRVRRALRTPVTDLLRGRLIDLTVAPDVRSVLHASGLPQPLQDLIANVCRRTRLWRPERADVAGELVAHFADGIDAGAAPEELLSRFGNPSRAARLIRRAKLRNRPRIWQAWRLARNGFVMLCLGYALLAAYYYAGKPAPSVDYVAQLNQPILATPVDQRAWPIYRQVVLDLGLNSPVNTDYRGEFSRMLDASPTSKRWPALVVWLGQHRSAIDLIHRAADRPQFGFVLGAGGSDDDPVLFPGPRSDGDAGMYNVAMPSLSLIRQLARVLGADATAAREADDRTRFLRDIRSLFELTEQARQHPSLVAQLLSVGVRAFMYDQLGQTLNSAHVAMLTDEDLRDLAHRLAGPRLAADLIDLRYERMFFHDVVQHAYTADGPGGGHLTPDGVRLLQHIIRTTQDTVPDQVAVLQAVAQPAALLLVASRDQALQRYDRLLDRAESFLQQPARKADWSDWDLETSSLKESLLASVLNYPVSILLPGLSQIGVTAERCLGVRDGLLCAVALETYRRHHGSTYPASLDALTPGLLPSIPLDPITGDPVKYALNNGRPVIYSVGDDRVDDHGVPPPKNQYAAAMSNPQNPAHGDWVLYPPAQEYPDAN